MASTIAEKLKRKCICGCEAGEHTALNAGSHIRLGMCTKCECPGFRPEAGGSGGRGRHSHGNYIRYGWKS
jgi:hypothetical protein